MRKINTTNGILEKGYDLNKLYSAYRNASDSKDRKRKWQLYYVAAEQYRSDFAEYLRSNPADIAKVL